MNLQEFIMLHMLRKHIEYLVDKKHQLKECSKELTEAQYKEQLLSIEEELNMLDNALKTNKL